LKGRVIRYKPVAKLSGKSGAKKGGMFKNPTGPASVNGNNSNQELDKFESVIIASIKWRAPEVEVYENSSGLYEEIKKLEQMARKSNIFNISTNDGIRDNSDEMGKSFVDIMINKLHTFNQNQNYIHELAFIIEFLKYCVEEAKKGNFLDFEFNLTEPKKEFTPNVNELLIYLTNQIYPIASTVNRNRKLRHVPAPKLLKNDPSGSAPLE
jgi:hypothetical protein